MKKIITAIIVLIIVPISLRFLQESLPSRQVASESASTTEYTVEDTEISEGSTEEFVKAVKYQILREPLVVQTQIGPGIRLGHFSIKGRDGKVVSVCEEFPTMDIIFAADGIAHSGEIPQMIVRGPCQTDVDQKHLEPLPTPFQEFVNSPVTQKSFKFYLPNSANALNLYFSNVLDTWPRDWTWVGVRLYGKHPEKILKIDGYEILSVTGEPITLSPQVTE